VLAAYCSAFTTFYLIIIMTKLKYFLMEKFAISLTHGDNALIAITSIKNAGMNAKESRQVMAIIISNLPLTSTIEMIIATTESFF
jgi:hypothetical protein